MEYQIQCYGLKSEKPAWVTVCYLINNHYAAYVCDFLNGQRPDYFKYRIMKKGWLGWSVWEIPDGFLGPPTANAPNRTR